MSDKPRNIMALNAIRRRFRREGVPVAWIPTSDGERLLQLGRTYFPRSFHLFILLVLSWSFTDRLHAQDSVLPSWSGVLRDTAGRPVSGATVHLASQKRKSSTTTRDDGGFVFKNMPAGSYTLSVDAGGRSIQYEQPILVDAKHVTVSVTLSDQGALTLVEQQEKSEATGGEQLSSRAVSELPLNKRDFSQLLLLAAGTMTDANGATNFTQQFAINGQRGVEATFAMDGADTSDGEE